MKVVKKKKKTIKDFKKDLKEFTAEDLKKEINTTLQSKTSDILHLMTCDDQTNSRPIIQMAVARACYLAYTEGDTKKLDWLLQKLGIKELIKPKEEADFSKIDNETILKSLSGGK
tara:strand:+ start:1273 stop:1617 length:345 start_codon:yes stop_codon:yes gene_type:complete